MILKRIKLCYPKKDEILAPTVKEMFNEIKEELENLKTFNKKLVDDVNDLKSDKYDDERGDDVRK